MVWSFLSSSTSWAMESLNRCHILLCAYACCRTDSCSKTSALARSETRRRERGCRWEARIWVGNETNKQIYLGGYETEELAAEAHDVAVLKTKGFSAHTNFSKDRCVYFQCQATSGTNGNIQLLNRSKACCSASFGLNCVLYVDSGLRFT